MQAGGEFHRSKMNSYGKQLGQPSRPGRTEKDQLELIKRNKVQICTRPPNG